jgi:hypothetical protein
MKTIIHINQHNIRHNIKAEMEERKPVITVKNYKENNYTNEVFIKKDGIVVAKLVYSPDKPLSCGARVWLEVDDKNVEIELGE